MVLPGLNLLGKTELHAYQHLIYDSFNLKWHSGVTRQTNAPSVEKAVKAAVAASGKIGWIPKTISVETRYMPADY